MVCKGLGRLVAVSPSSDCFGAAWCEKMYWTVAQTKPNAERVAQLNLQRQQFLTYLPVFAMKVGKVTKIKVLFPRYIFVQIEQQWHSINSTIGISRLILTNENKPAILSDKIIEGLKAREEKGLIILEPKAKFKPGENVKIVNGPFSGYSALYQEMRDSERSRILIELLGRSVQIEVNENDLSAVAIKAE